MTTTLHTPQAALALLLSLAAAGAAAADGAPPAPPTEATWGVGLLLSTELKPYTGVGSETRLLPILQYNSPLIRVAGPMVELKLRDGRPYAVSLVARLDDSGYKASDASALSGMAERKSSVWLGARAAWRTQPGQLWGEWVGDVAGKSKGQQIRLMADTLVPVAGIGLVPRVGLVWQDRKYVDYYYGVRSSEARPGRPVYSPSSSLNAELGLRLLSGVAPRQSVFVDIGTTFLGSAVKDSPLVDRSTTSSLRLGYIYSF